jgi:hypothetical protein
VLDLGFQAMCLHHLVVAYADRTQLSANNVDRS